MKVGLCCSSDNRFGTKESTEQHWAQNPTDHSNKLSTAQNWVQQQTEQLIYFRAMWATVRSVSLVSVCTYSVCLELCEHRCSVCSVLYLVLNKLFDERQASRKAQKIKFHTILYHFWFLVGSLQLATMKAQIKWKICNKSKVIWKTHKPYGQRMKPKFFA